jgi:hypothetical protein
MIAILPLIVSYYISIRDFYFTIDPAYMDIVKIFAGSIGWVGGLALYMWIREKKKESARLLSRQLAR